MLEKQIQRWIRKKLPPAEQVELSLHNIMILPTRLGMVVLLLCVMLFLLAVNYENSMGFALSFFLLSLWLLALHLTFQNLSGLVIRLCTIGQAHVGDDLAYQFEFSDSRKQNKCSIEGFWQKQNRTRFDIEPGQKTQQTIYCKALKRGYFDPGRLQLESYFPLMLFRAWSSVALSRKALVFPKPVACELPLAQVSDPIQAHKAQQQQGLDELANLRTYQPGDPFHMIAWKASARQPQGLISKGMESPVEQNLWLDYDVMPGPSHELKLSQLCYWCIELEQRKACYGLSVGEQKLAPNRGADHHIQCLTLLAKQPGVAHEAL